MVISWKLIELILSSCLQSESVKIRTWYTKGYCCLLFYMGGENLICHNDGRTERVSEIRGWEIFGLRREEVKKG
jgi:hypothetical protein